jgi:hypothetical protein
MRRLLAGCQKGEGKGAAEKKAEAEEKLQTGVRIHSHDVKLLFAERIPYVGR